MSATITKPSSIPEVLDQGFGLYRRSLVKLLPLSFLSMILPAIPTVLMMLLTQALKHGSKLTNGNAILFVLLTFVLQLAGILASYWMRAATLLLADDIAQNRVAASPFSYLMRKGASPLRLLVATVLFVLCIAVGFIFLIIPGIWLSVGCSLFMYFIVIERTGIVDSLQRSRELVSGHWWRVATIDTVAVLVYLAFFVATLALVSLLIPIGNMTQWFITAKDLPMVGQLVVQGLSICVGTLVAPLILCMGLVLFRDLQLRKGGQDLAARIDQTA